MKNNPILQKIKGFFLVARATFLIIIYILKKDKAIKFQFHLVHFLIC